MPSIVLEHIKGEEVTKRIGEALELDPGGTYRVTVPIENEALANATSFPELAKLLRRRAQSRGLTPERLTDLLDSDA
jgi:hypothetical protein